MNNKTKEFLFTLLNTPSPAGFESEGQRTWMNYVRSFADSLENDAYGNVWATLAGGESSARIMLEAHADEIGFMIQHITEEGFLYVTRIGGSDRAIARGKRLTILADKGPVRGVIGNTAIHIRDKEHEKIPEVHELNVDIGANSKEEVEGRGIRVGHPAIYADTAEELVPGRIVGRAIDNRIGGFILSQVLANLTTKCLPSFRDRVRGERSAGRDRRFRHENDFVPAGTERRSRTRCHARNRFARNRSEQAWFHQARQRPDSHTRHGKSSGGSETVDLVGKRARNPTPTRSLFTHDRN